MGDRVMSQFVFLVLVIVAVISFVLGFSTTLVVWNRLGRVSSYEEVEVLSWLEAIRDGLWITFLLLACC